MAAFAYAHTHSLQTDTHTHSVSASAATGGSEMHAGSEREVRHRQMYVVVPCSWKLGCITGTAKTTKTNTNCQKDNNSRTDGKKHQGESLQQQVCPTSDSV